MFASAVYIYLDLETGVMTASTAGHPHPIILGPDGVARKMPLPRGIALGLLDDATYHNAQFSLLAGPDPDVHGRPDGSRQPGRGRNGRGKTD